MTAVRQPIRAAANAASHPACPDPTTSTSKSVIGGILPIRRWEFPVDARDIPADARDIPADIREFPVDAGDIPIDARDAYGFRL